jgi:hypothetical protein
MRRPTVSAGRNEFDVNEIQGASANAALRDDLLGKLAHAHRGPFEHRGAGSLDVALFA